MAVVIGSANQDFIHVAGDGFVPPPGFNEIDTATNAADDITGGAQADIVFAGGGDDTVTGDDGHDTLVGGQGTDRLFGGTGNDLFQFLGVSDISGLAERISGGADIDTMDFERFGASGAVDLTAAIISGIETLILRSNEVTLTSAQLGAFEQITGSGFVERLILSDGGLADLSGAAITAIDAIRGNALANTLRLNGVAQGQRVELFEGADSLDGSDAGDIAEGGTGADTLRGRGGFDLLRGEDDNDVLDGAAGNDTLIGGAGTDNQSGGAGSDVLRIEFASDIGGLAETLAGGGDRDTLEFFGTTAIGPCDITVAVITGIELLNVTAIDLTLRAGQLSGFDSISGTGFVERLILAGGGTANLTGAAVTGIDEIRGSSSANIILLTDVLTGQFVDARDGDDNVAGSLGADRLHGGFGNDTLLGSEGRDTLLAGQGIDVIDGGIGNDTILIAGVSDVSGLAEIIDGGNDSDTLDFSALGASGFVDLTAATLSGIEQLVITDLDMVMTAAQLSGFDTVFGSGFSETITISDGGLVDLAGATITFIDSIIASNAGNSIVFTGGSGIATFQGGAAADTILAGNANSFLFGEGGNDTLAGGQGSDLIAGGIGTDSLTGGLGADTFDFNDLAELGRGAARDVITDFVHGTDVIDLNGVDANTEAAGNQAFSFIGTLAFDGVTAGQLRYAGDLLSGDVDGDGAADFQIRLVGAPVVTLSDLVL
jgi:Ca2+-binding RTX toxin-like protein